MKRAIHTVFAGGLMALVVGLSQGSALAQYYNPYGVYYQNQLNQQAWAVQQMYAAQATQGAYVAQAAMANPYSPYGAGNPYSPLGAGGMGGGAGMSGFSPFSPFGGYGYGGYGNSPGIGYGFALAGQAEVMKGYGTALTSEEQARILREQANQAKLETRKKEFDLNMYIKSNTPTYTQEQARVAKETLKRIQSVALPGEITNGTSLNTLLKDLRKYPNKKISLQPLQLPDSVLLRVNVTKNNYGVGLLRDGNRLAWPVAIKDLMTVNQRQDLDKQIKAISDEAHRGRQDNNAIKDVRNEMDKITNDLVIKCNEIPRSQYLDAKRFLQDFDQSLVAVEKGEARVQADFQRFIEGGKSIQQVADYMIENGLRFGPATADDEAAYRAVHDRLSKYDVEMNIAMGVDGDR